MDNLLNRKIDAEKQNIEQVILIIEKYRTKSLSDLELAGIATFIHNFYNGIENILKQILKSKNIKLTNSPSWHKDLLLLSNKNNIIDDELLDNLLNFLSFRHFFVHSYSFILDKDELDSLLDQIFIVWTEFKFKISNYLIS